MKMNLLFTQMKKMTVVFGLSCAILACEENTTPVDDIVHINGITLNKTEAEMLVGEELTLIATVTPDNASDPSVTWSVSDGTIIQVNDGKITALSPGNAVVTAAAGVEDEFKATCQITVSEPAEPAKPAQIGDYYYADGTWSSELDASKTVIGVVFSVSPDRTGASVAEILGKNVNGLVVALKDASKSAVWSTNNQDEEIISNTGTFQAAYEDIDGLAKTKAVWETYADNLDSYPAFKAVKEFNDIVPAPESTTGWFLPAIGQFWDLFRNFGELTELDDIASGKEKPAMWFVFESAVCDKINGFFDGTDADLFSAYCHTSSEGDMYRNWHARTSSSMTTMTNDYKNNEYTVRAILAF